MDQHFNINDEYNVRIRPTETPENHTDFTNNSHTFLLKNIETEIFTLNNLQARLTYIRYVNNLSRLTNKGRTPTGKT